MTVGPKQLLIFACLCAIVLAKTLTTVEINNIVAEHNNARANPQPPSDGPINPIRYQATTSNGLPSMESVASAWAEGCSLRHNDGRGNGFPAGNYVGENIAAFGWYGNTPSNTVTGFFKQASDFWVGEKVDFYFDSNGRGKCQSGKTCGHYTQVAWNNTAEFGCGYQFCNGGALSGNWIFIVCNYLQAGNFNGYDAYRPGTGAPPPCSPSCPAGQCGAVSSCGQTLQCGCGSGQYCSSSSTCATCPNPCTANSCGAVYDPTCGRTVNCASSCANGYSCSNNVCVPPTSTATSTSTHTPAPSSSNTPVASPTPSSTSTASLAASQSPSPAPLEPSQTPSNTPVFPPAPSETPSSSPPPAPPCDPLNVCRAIGNTCGAVTACDGVYSCGECAATQQCQTGQCVERPCGGACGQNQNCVNNQCVCFDGYQLVNGVCQVIAIPVHVDYSRDFRTTRGTPALSFPDTEMVILGSGVQTVEWGTVKSIIDPYNTKIELDVTVTSGSFGVAFRKGQYRDGRYYENDMVVVEYANIGTPSECINLNLIYYNQPNVWGPFTFMPRLNTAPGSSNRLEFELTIDDWSNSVNVIVRDRGYYFTGATSVDYYPAVGGVGFDFNPQSTSYPALANIQLATSTTLAVTLYECLDTEEWARLFYEATGADPATTSVQARASGENGNCAKGASVRGMKEAASAMTVVLSSTVVSSKALASSFIASVESGSTATAGLAVQSAAIVPGSQGAMAAGVPVGTAVAPAFVPSAAGGGAAAGGGGGAGGGLSGGAIAGIVVGSVAGGVLAIGLVGAVVVAVVVAAAVIAKKSMSSDSDSSEDMAVEEEKPSRAESQPRSIRQTVYNLFRGPRGGVNVMGGEKGHQSISARAPPMQ